MLCLGPGAWCVARVPSPIIAAMELTSLSTLAAVALKTAHSVHHKKISHAASQRSPGHLHCHDGAAPHTGRHGHMKRGERGWFSKPASGVRNTGENEGWGKGDFKKVIEVNVIFFGKRGYKSSKSCALVWFMVAKKTPRVPPQKQYK